MLLRKKRKKVKPNQNYQRKNMATIYVLYLNPSNFVFVQVLLCRAAVMAPKCLLSW